jgi:hypothetical protein
MAERSVSKAGPSGDWLELGFTENGSYPVLAQFGSQVASLEGRVSDGTSPARYAPVVMFPKDFKLRQRMHGPRTVYASDQGKYKIGELPPGEYLAGSSWDLDEVTAESLAAIGAKLITLKRKADHIKRRRLGRAGPGTLSRAVEIRAGD